MRDSTQWPRPDTAAADTAAADSTRDTTSIFYDVPLARGGTMHVRRPAEPDLQSPVFQQYRLLRGMAEPVRAFTIAQTDSTLTITNEDGFTYTVRPGGDPTTIPFNDSVTVEAHAKWDNGVLVIEYRPTGGGKVIEKYHLADSQQYLRLEVEVQHKTAFRRYWRTRMYRRLEPSGS